MPGKKLKSCERKVRSKIKFGEIPKTYKKGKKSVKTNPYAICKSSMTGKKFNKKHWRKSKWD